MAYTKLHQSILSSTVWLEPHATRIVWITLLALANKHGEVTAAVPGLAHQARVTIDECRTAMATFLAPDPDSRTPDEDGRRLEVIPGGWQILNYEKYRLEASKDDQREKTAARTRRWRERKASGPVTQKPSHLNGSDGVVTHDRDIAEAEAEGDISSRDSESSHSTESLAHTNRARANLRGKTARPSRVQASDFAGAKNGSHGVPIRAPIGQPVPSDWKPSQAAQDRLIKSLPWITREIADLRHLEFMGWAAGKTFPPAQLDAVWLGFMVKTKRDAYPQASQGWNG